MVSLRAGAMALLGHQVGAVMRMKSEQCCMQAKRSR